MRNLIATLISKCQDVNDAQGLQLPSYSTNRRGFITTAVVTGTTLSVAGATTATTAQGIVATAITQSKDPAISPGIFAEFAELTYSNVDRIKLSTGNEFLARFASYLGTCSDPESIHLSFLYNLPDGDNGLVPCYRQLRGALSARLIDANNLLYQLEQGNPEALQELSNNPEIQSLIDLRGLWYIQDFMPVFSGQCFKYSGVAGQSRQYDLTDDGIRTFAHERLVESILSIRRTLKNFLNLDTFVQENPSSQIAKFLIDPKHQNSKVISEEAKLVRAAYMAHRRNFGRPDWYEPHLLEPRILKLANPSTHDNTAQLRQAGERRTERLAPKALQSIRYAAGSYIVNYGTQCSVISQQINEAQRSILTTIFENTRDPRIGSTTSNVVQLFRFKIDPASSECVFEPYRETFQRELLSILKNKFDDFNVGSLLLVSKNGLATVHDLDSRNPIDYERTEKQRHRAYQPNWKFHALESMIQYDVNRLGLADGQYALFFDQTGKLSYRAV